jgi:radical SAM protein with 4Fe4S-binding SPASM domain
MKVREVDINITNMCNLNCIHCAFSSHYTSKDRLNLDIYKKYINDLSNFGLEDVHLTGGEPTLHPDLPNMISYAVNKNINVRLITNGYMLNASKLKKYMEYGLSSIMISLDGLERTHNMIRGKNDAFNKTINNIQIAKELGYNIRINAVISKLNMHELNDLILFIASLNVDVFSFFLYSPTGRDAIQQINNVLGANEWKNLITNIRKEIKLSDVGNLQIAFEKGYYYFNNDSMDFDTYIGRGGGCYYLANICDYLIILANGDVYPCALLTDKNISYGNINKKDINDILYDRDNINIYKNFENKFDKCITCIDWNYCKGACKAFVYTSYGRWDKSDPRCTCDYEKKILYTFMSSA